MRYCFGIMLAALLTVGAAGCAHHPSKAEASIGRWNEHHPEAARDLCQWVGAYPDASRRLFEWESNHPERAHDFVTWAIHHPNQGVGAFVDAHPGWSNLDFLAETHRPGANAFLDWCRRHPRAAEALMNHPDGLQWASHHGSC